MEQSLFASGLDSVFAGFDHAILEAYHGLALQAGGFATPFFIAVSWLGNLGAVFILMALILLFFKKSRRLGVCVLIALVIGWLLSDVVIKELVARARPYADFVGEYHLWWQQVGAWTESSHSFPSGHTTAAAAAMFVIFWQCDKRISWLAILPALLMGASRNYLMVHYPSDVAAGLILGFLAAVLACLLLRLLEKLWHRPDPAKSTAPLP